MWSKLYSNLGLRAVLLTLTLLGSCLVGQAQPGKIDQHGWKLIFVTYKTEPAYEAGHKEYGEPSAAFFVKVYPYQVGKEYPKLLSMSLTEARTTNRPGVDLSKTLYEFDCGRLLSRIIRRFWTDGREEDTMNMITKPTWLKVLPDTPMEAMLKYACRPR